MQGSKLFIQGRPDQVQCRSGVDAVLYYRNLLRGKTFCKDVSTPDETATALARFFNANLLNGFSGKSTWRSYKFVFFDSVQAMLAGMYPGRRGRE